MVKEHLPMLGGVSDFLRSGQLHTFRPAWATAFEYRDATGFVCVAVSGRS